MVFIGLIVSQRSVSEMIPATRRALELLTEPPLPILSAVSLQLFKQQAAEGGVVVGEKSCILF